MQEFCVDCGQRLAEHEGRRCNSCVAKRKKLAGNLFRAARWHKEKCHEADCNISVYMLGEVYQILMGRDLTKEEGEVFL